MYSHLASLNSRLAEFSPRLAEFSYRLAGTRNGAKNSWYICLLWRAIKIKISQTVVPRSIL